MRSLVLWNCLIIKLLLFSLFSFVSLEAQKKQYIPGKSYFGQKKYIEYIAGNLPVIISIPHGGQLKPAEIPDRTYGTTITDAFTDLLGKQIAKEIYQRTKKYPHLIICNLKRTKIDCNRDLEEGVQGNPQAKQAWSEFHQFIEVSKKRVLKQYKKGLFLDLHGHGHKLQRIELGYLLSKKQLQKNNKQLKSLKSKGSISKLLKISSASFSELLRGKTSFGGLLEERGYPCVPSPKNPDAGENPYFNGGYNTIRYGASKNGLISGFQVEVNSILRKNVKKRKEFAGIFAEVTLLYLRLHYKLFFRRKK